MTRPSKQERQKKAVARRQKQRERSQTMGARDDVRNVRHDEGWGTSPGSMGRVKQQSEEAKLLSCPECGYSGGRHSMACPLK